MKISEMLIGNQEGTIQVLLNEEEFFLVEVYKTLENSKVTVVVYEKAGYTISWDSDSKHWCDLNTPESQHSDASFPARYGWKESYWNHVSKLEQIIENDGINF